MKTDAFFYEAFTFDPQLVADLTGIPLEGPYDFDSISTKMIEKRFDGCFRPLSGEGPLVFLEVQGYNDPQVYWRLFREIATYFELRRPARPFIAIILYVEEAFRAPAPLLDVVSPCKLLALSLEECLEAAHDKKGAITALKPLVLGRVSELKEKIPQWRSEIEGLDLPDHRGAKLFELLAYAIVQRFPGLNMKEVDAMIHLTPLDETNVGKELIARGIALGEARGVAIGVTRGELLGKILAYQELLGESDVRREHLQEWSLEDLESRAVSLREKWSRQR